MTKMKNKIDRKPDVDWRISALASELGGTTYLRGKTLWFDQGSGLHDLQLTHDHDNTNGDMRPLGEWDSPENVEVAMRKLTRLREARCRAGSTRARAHDALDAATKHYGEFVGREGWHYAITDCGDCAVFLWTFLSPKQLSVSLVGGPAWETDIDGKESFNDAVARLRRMIDADCGAAP